MAGVNHTEVLGGLHHLAISVPLETWSEIQARLAAAGVEYTARRQRTSAIPTAPGRN
jgi:hypothetical protein